MMKTQWSQGGLGMLTKAFRLFVRATFTFNPDTTKSCKLYKVIPVCLSLKFKQKTKNKTSKQKSITTTYFCIKRKM